MTSVLDEENQRGPGGSAPRTAGGMLREARLAQGLSVAALATMLKVPVAKLEALESDRLDALPDATFVRALAKAVCAALKIEVTPVLERLPKGGMPELDRVSRGLNQPFRERQAGGDLLSAPWLKRPVTWGVAALLAAAGGVYLLPQEGWQWPWQQGDDAVVTAAQPTDEAVPAQAVAPAASMVSVSVSESVAPPSQGVSASKPEVASVTAGLTPMAAAPAADRTAPAAMPPAASKTQAGTAPADPRLAAVKIRARDASWVEVLDVSGQVLHSRLMRAGEVAEVSGLPPLKLRVGNVAGTEVSFRGALIDLAAQARDNVARVELP